MQFDRYRRLTLALAMTTLAACQDSADEDEDTTGETTDGGETTNEDETTAGESNGTETSTTSTSGDGDESAVDGDGDVGDGDGDGVGDGDGDGDGDGSGADLPDSLVASIDGLCVTVAACGLDDEASCTTFLNDTAPFFGASCYAAFEDLFVCMEALECDELEVFWTALTNDTPPTGPKACSAEVEATLAC